MVNILFGCFLMMTIMTPLYAQESQENVFDSNKKYDVTYQVSNDRVDIVKGVSIQGIKEIYNQKFLVIEAEYKKGSLGGTPFKTKGFILFTQIKSIMTSGSFDIELLGKDEFNFSPNLNITIPDIYDQQSKGH